MEAKKMYWVGLNNRMGRTRYRYYARRGWVHGNYFAKPASKTMEWLRCLVSPSHARTTWLRIDPETERKALTVCLGIVIVLFAAACFIWGVGFGEQRAVHYIQSHQVQVIEQQS